MPTKNRVSLGTVSHGTLLDRDLIPVFIAELRSLVESDDDKSRQASMMNWLEVEEVEANHYLENEDEVSEEYEPSEIVSELIDRLNDYAPEFCYFGSHEGDGSDFGFWIAKDAVYEAVQTDEVVRVDSLPSYLLEVNDHGNTTLYRVSLEEVWSVV